MTTFLETDRLRLREFRESDVDNLVALDSDPEVMRYLSGGTATPRKIIETQILPRFMASNSERSGPGYWAAEGRRAGEFLGWFALHPNDDGPPNTLELGYRLRRETWGRGLATEGARALVEVGFRDLHAHRIFAQTYEDNAASRRVMEKAGMRFVRSFRVSSAEELAGGTFVADGAALFPGEDVEYAIERDEWMLRSGQATPA
ncbi:MAG: GNAT family N-acetyltransferase [Dehalococcoidia bacterium]